MHHSIIGLSRFDIVWILETSGYPTYLNEDTETLRECLNECINDGEIQYEEITL